MRKTTGILILVLVISLILSFAGCASQGGSATPTPAATQAPTQAPAAKNLKLGMAVVTMLSGADASSDADGLAQADSVVAAVLLDSDNKIVSCIIDTAQNKMNFTAEGKVKDIDKVFKTKKELGDDYGMKARSKIGKEWFEQAKALEDYVVGKTADEVEGIAVSDTSVPTDKDLSASVTVKIADYQKAIVAACKDAKDLGSAAGDKLGLGIETTMEDSIDATADADGFCHAYSNYAAVTTNANGEITASIIDSTQSKILFDTKGVIKTDLEGTKVLTKRELGDDYGMKARSNIGKEWFEQTKALSDYVVGMTADEVKGIAVSDTTAPTDKDLSASVTIKIGHYQNVLVKAISNAK